MSVYKRQYKSGEEVWAYLFSAAGATRKDRRQIQQSAFKTKKEAQDAEAARRAEDREAYKAAQRGAVLIAGGLPKTLDQLLQEFFRQRECRLGLKTLEEYRDGAAKLSPELLAMPIQGEEKIRPLHLTREWSRLLASGGRTRRTKAPRPMQPKTVTNIAGTVSSAFGFAVKQGFIEVNPVAGSELPKLIKRKKVALATRQQDLLVAAASGPWCMAMILEMDAGLGARRGEVLALRWSDIDENGRVTIARSLSQTARIVDGVKVHDVLTFKPTKTDEIRVVGLPEPTLTALEEHRNRQQVFRQQYGRDYVSDLDLIFANTDGTPLRPNSISSTVSALFKKLNIPKPKGAAMHLLRHSHGSHLLANGVPLPAVSARLGHSSVRTTAEIYAHEIHGQDDDAVRKWEDFQRKSRGAEAPAGRQIQ